MKSKSLILGLSIVFLGFNLCGCGKSIAKTNTESNWKVIKTIDIKHNSYIGGYNDENFGITAGPSAEIHYTTDGSKTWLQGNNTSACLFGLEIVNNKIAWSCGNMGYVRKTTDGGANWNAVKDFGEPEPNQCRYLSFLDENTGWIAAPKKLGSTRDGGKTWTEITLPNASTDILAISLISENEGFFVDSASTLYSTTDGGKTWSNKRLNIKGMDNVVWPTNGSILKFFDSKKAVLFYYDQNAKLRCARTSDGGAVWKDEILPSIEGDGLYLSKDGKYLSVNSDSNAKITVLKYK